ncbi:Myotubularin [Entamoeba marina]
MESTLSITNQRSFFIRNSSVVHLLHSSVAFAGLYSLDVFDVLAFVSKDVRIILHELSPTSTPRIIQVYSAHRLLFSKRKFFVGSTRIYDALFDFKRLGIIDSSLFVVAQNTSSSSHNPSLLQFDSPSYPPMVLLPNNNYTMSHLTNYRAKGRFPVVIWSGVHKQCLLRSSQPLPGTFGLTQCSDDVRILEKILKQTNKRVFYVYDARPKLSTKATRLQGGGMESQSNYPFCMFENLALDGIKEVKASFTKIMKIILFERRDVYDFKTSIESSGWLKSQHQLLTYAVVLANKLYSGESMLIHCRNGWDTTCSLCSLIMLMVDPFYRTVEGFLVLIEHQWLAMGHKFPLRTGVGAKWDIDPLPFISSLYGVVKRVNTSCFVTDTDVVNGKAVAPIFLQFLEAIHHMICYDQSAFQFNDKLLVFIADCLYDSRFSTFYVEHTPDSISAGELYDAVLDNLDQYLNPTYKNNSDGFFPSFNTTEFDLWEEYFFRYPSNVIQIRPASVSLV